MILAELRANAWKITAGVAAALAVAALIGLLYFRGISALSDARAAQAESERDSARQEVVSLKEAIETERRRTQAMTAIAKDYEEQKDAAAVESERVIADLRAGNLRLRKLWQAQAATADLSEAVARAAEPDEGARGREESAAAIVRAADECDAQVRGLQQVIEADRRE